MPCLASPGFAGCGFQMACRRRIAFGTWEQRGFLAISHFCVALARPVARFSDMFMYRIWCLEQRGQQEGCCFLRVCCPGRRKGKQTKVISIWGLPTLTHPHTSHYIQHAIQLRPVSIFFYQVSWIPGRYIPTYMGLADSAPLTGA